MIKEIVEESIAAKRAFFEKNSALVQEAADRIIAAIRRGNKLLLFGNGGSAADAQHIAAEFVGRYGKDRRALPAIALTTDTSILTCIGNDMSFDAVFSRQLESLGKEGDVAIAISTSGNSPNVLQGIARAREIGVYTIGFTGRDGGKMGAAVDLHLNVSAASTARVQEVHILIAHILCEIIEGAFCK